METSDTTRVHFFCYWWSFLKAFSYTNRNISVLSCLQSLRLSACKCRQELLGGDPKLTSDLRWGKISWRGWQWLSRHLYVYQPCQCHRLYKAKTSYSFSYFCLKVIDAWLYLSHIANVLAIGFLVVNVSLFIFKFSQHWNT